jgi:hypothetical protein
MTHATAIRAAGVVALLLALPAAGAGQSLLSSGGLGMPTGAADARGRMLGGATVGLSGAHYAPSDPAAAARLVLGTLEASMASGIESLDDGPTTGRTRFPSFGVAYPYRGNVYTLGFAGVLSHEWRAEAIRTVAVGEGLDVEARDRFEARGGIGAFQLGLARPVTPSLAVGVNVGRYMGTVDRSFRRELDPEGVGPDVEAFVARGSWRAGGTSVTASASWDVTSLVRVGLGATWSGDLVLEPDEGTTGGELTVPLPLELRAGAHAGLAPDLALVASVHRADWSDAAQALGDAAAPGAVLNWGLGVEWEGSSLLGRRVPLALGYRQGDLPFSFRGSPATESAFTGGLGIHLAESEGVPWARVHVGLEGGTRSSGTAEESFFRTTVTFRLTGG